jgi:quercetin dioxygenase-like cupin family protein
MTRLVLWLWLAGIVLALAFRIVMVVRSRRRAARARSQPGYMTRARRTAGTEAAMRSEQPGPGMKGVTVKLLATLDLGPEIEGMAGRQLRMRMVTIEPGGVFGPIHDHRDRPGMVYVLQGTITDHRDGVSTDYGPGVGWPEDKSTTHWLENRGTTPAVEISVDIVRQP